jgi:flagella basal body P-ring formation protein FlgA
MKKIVGILILLGLLFGACLPLEAGSPGQDLGRAKGDQGRQTVPETRFYEIFRQYLLGRLEKEASDVLISKFEVNGNKSVPRGTTKYHVYQKDKGRLSGYVRLEVAISVNGMVENKVRLSGWVDVFGPVICAARNLKKGEIINADDLYMARKNISRLSTDVLRDMDSAVGLIAKHSIRQGTWLKDWMVEKRPTLARGDVVTILAESGDLRVTVPGKVLEEGYKGALIRVQNVMSRKEIYATVVNGSTVTVDF